MPKQQSRNSEHPPKGFQVKPYTIKDDPNLKGWFNFRIWRDGRCILEGAATAFSTPSEAKRVGVGYAWDIFEGRSSWS